MGNVFTLSVAVFALALASCSPDLEEPVAEARSPIEGGVLDLSDGGVVGVIVTDSSGYPRRSCTGTLIAPNLVLTAQHCVAHTTPFVNCARSVFGPPASADLVRVTASPAMWGPGTAWTPAASIVVPPGSSSVCGRDVALIVLREPLPESVAPLSLRLDDAVRADERYAAVGYGARDGDGEGSGLRRRRDQLRVVCVGDTCQTRQVDDGEWRGDHGICNGDSGGPAIDENGAVIGVTSRGPKGCDRPIYGSLAHHAEWLRGEARLAVQKGGFAEPAWVSGARPPQSAEPPSTGANGGACAAAPSEARAAAWGWPALAVVGIAAACRRRARACFRRGRH